MGADYTTYCMVISVRGMLNWTRAETKKNLKNITKNDGSRYASVEEFRNDLMDELGNGNEVLPLNKDCDKHDPKKGCQGHRKEQGDGWKESTSESQNAQ